MPLGSYNKGPDAALLVRCRILLVDPLRLSNRPSARSVCRGSARKRIPQQCQILATRAIQRHEMYRCVCVRAHGSEQMRKPEYTVETVYSWLIRQSCLCRQATPWGRDGPGVASAKARAVLRDRRRDRQSCPAGLRSRGCTSPTGVMVGLASPRRFSQSSTYQVITCLRPLTKGSRPKSIPRKGMKGLGRSEA